MNIRLPVLAALLASCGNQGDGRESETSKQEWGMLQVLEAAGRDNKNRGIEVMASGDRRILSLMDRHGETRIWIMLDPQSPPFYKQMPPNRNYDITAAELETIRVSGNPISSTYQVLMSHLR